MGKAKYKKNNIPIELLNYWIIELVKTMDRWYDISSAMQNAVYPSASLLY